MSAVSALPFIMNSKPLELPDQIHNFFPQLSWSGCFTPETEKQWMHAVHVCAWVQVSVGAWSQHQAFPSTFFHLMSWRVSHRNYNLQISGVIRTARPWGPSDCLSPVLLWEAHTATPGFLMWVLEGTLGHACACSKCVTHGASCPAQFSSCLKGRNWDT